MVVRFSRSSCDPRGEPSQPAAQAPRLKASPEPRELTIGPLALILMAETYLPAAVIADCLDRDIPALPPSE